MQQKDWVYKCSGLKREKAEEFAKKFGMSLVMAVVFLNRGIDTEEKLKKYLKKPLECIYNPMLLPNMEKALEKIKSALEKHEKITIYGDYDADGVTSTSILYMFLSEIGANVDYYIPDRFSEGYGLNIMAVNRISKSGTKLLITVDCGIVSTGEVQLAKAQGMEVIITDHHTPQEKLPEAIIVHPRLEGTEYPFGELAGVGVAFKLILGLGVALGMKSSEVFEKYVGIAAIGTIADVVPLKDENRVIVDKGIKALKNTENFGLNSLMDIAGINRDIMTAEAVAFGISPRINAVGRLEKAKTAVELILADTPQEGYAKALELDEKNRKRQTTEHEILEDALDMINKDCNFSKKKVIVLMGKGWHHGVIGIVASRICEKFYKPCIMLSEEDGIAKGSARSVPGFNMFEALNECADLLTKFGGHAQAAGLTLSAADVERFSGKINKYADSVLTEADMVRKIEIDCRITPGDVGIEYVTALSALEPYGAQNEKPVFSLCKMNVLMIGRIGKDGKHLRMRLTSNGKYMNCVGFGMGEYADEIKEGDLVDVAFCMDINDFNGTKSVQLMLKDIKKTN